ncbi:MAG: hypothetical protein CMD07_06155 [Flavobacteriales bacterium]|nr:hypothetical protein [Flavobacteriales bacterium]
MKFLRLNILHIIISLLILIFLLSPIIFLLFNSIDFISKELSYLLEIHLYDYSFNTIYLIFLTLFFSIFFSIIPSWIISTHKFKFRNLLDILLYLPLSIPTYIMAYTYGDILSFTGPIQFFFRKYLKDFSYIINNDYLQIEVLGIILALSLYPYLYASTRIAFSMIGSTYSNKAENLGMSDFYFFYKLLLPLSRPALLLGSFLIIMEVLNDYGAVVYFGVNTFTSGIFRLWFSMGSEKSAVILSLFLLTIILFLSLIENRIYNKSRFYFFSQNNSHNRLKKLNSKFFPFLFISIPIFFGFILPVSYLIFNAINTITELNHLFFVTLNSICLSSISATICVFITLIFIFLNKFNSIYLSKFIEKIMSIGYTIPGAVIGLSFMILISKFSILTSFSVLTYAYCFRFLAVAKSPIKSSYDKVPDDYKDLSNLLKLSKFSSLKKVYFPLTNKSVFIAFILVFIDILKELPITLILRPFNFDTLASSTYELASDEMLSESSIYSLLIVFISSFLLVFLKFYSDDR